ncbi:siderophore ABC transporter substrate-binding protein [Paenibacillus pinistramenti]|uniref:siderophore ABC transporter substrate-binding protein n=1 Tax=Paenibacillus pinistramenti TaxID=1768003 RepID=UPI001107BF41|nr:siderophore ABC transporter substrate-binding protein [Paenibacillus pinistramenti]
MVLVLTMIMTACGQNKNTAGQKSNNNGSTQEAAAAAAPAESAATTEEIVVKHQLGEAHIQKNPQKVVVFDYGALDTLDKLGVEVAGVPRDNVPPYLKKYEDSKYENVGSLKEADFEKVNALNPDLIIISGRLQDSYDELNKIAPTIYMQLDTANYMASFKENVETLGRIFGKEQEAEQELAALDSKIKALHDQVTASGKNALIVLANEGKISAFGAGSRFGIIHDVFGFKPADADIEASTHGQSVSFEYVMEKNPDYLFVVDRSAVVAGEGEAAPAKQVIENDLVKNTNAYKEGHIVYLDPNYWYLSGGGLESLAEMLQEVESSL